MHDDDEDEEMEMPIPCENCGRIFDLNDGYGSEKWYPTIVICEECHNVEQEEIETDDDIEDCQNAISDAEYTLKERGAELIELNEKLKKLADKRENLKTGEQ